MKMAIIILLIIILLVLLLIVRCYILILKELIGINQKISSIKEVIDSIKEENFPVITIKLNIIHSLLSWIKQKIIKDNNNSKKTVSITNTKQFVKKETNKQVPDLVKNKTHKPIVVKKHSNIKVINTEK